MFKFFVAILIFTNIYLYPQSFNDTFYVNPGNYGYSDGTSWETGWRDFTVFDINTQVTDNSLLLVGTGTYTKGHQNYDYDTSRAVIMIKNHRNLTIRKYPVPPLEGGGEPVWDVIINPVDTIEYGIWLQPTDQDISVKRITIDGISFRSIEYNAIRISGFNFTNRVDTVLLKDCDIRDGTGRAVFCQRSDHITVDNAYISSDISINSENDGIYMQNVNNVLIKNSKIQLSNSYSGTPNPHLDCIQITRMYDQGTEYVSSNILVENNYCENSSNVGYDYRQVIHMTYTSGFIKIWNNILKSKKGDGVINIHYTENTDELKIYNNTFYAEGDQRSILGVVYYPIGEDIGYNPFHIMNNIFYKNNTPVNSYVLLKFANVDTAGINKNSLNHNLYFINSHPATVYKTAFAEYDGSIYSNEYNVNWDYDDWEDNGKSENPLFTSSTDLKLNYSSGAKNIGKGLSEIQNDYYGNSRPYWNYDYDAGAFEIEDTQFKIGAIGLLGNPTIKHSLKAYGTYWERSSTPGWIISSDQHIDSSAFNTIGNTPSDIDSLYGWEYKWLDRSGDDQDTSIGAGLYEISNNYNNSEARFYIDLRDAIQDYSLNVYIQYNGSTDRYQYNKNGSWIDIFNETVIRIWDINDGNTNTQNLSSYWLNALVPLEKNNHPYLVWGPYIDQQGLLNYRVNRKNGGLPFAALQPDISPDTMEYLDEFISLATIQGGHTVLYYVSAIEEWTSTPSDTVDYEAEGNDPGKAAGKFSPVSAYSLEQNYPNPFNPTTKILFSIKREEYVTLKLYDILGRELKTLVSQVLLPGNHEVIFNGDDLASGIYIYRISSGKFSAVKKMQVLK